MKRRERIARPTRREPVLRAATPIETAPTLRAVPWLEAMPAESQGGVRDLANRLLEHAGLAVLAFATVLLLGLAYYLLVTPVYRVDALVQMDERAPGAPAGFGGNAIGTTQANALAAPYLPVSGEMEILRSRELVMNAIAISHADIKISVENRIPLIGAWYARRYAEQGGTGVAPAPFGLTAFAWGGEKLDLQTFDIPSYLYGESLFVERHGRDWILYDADRRFVFSGPFGQTVDVNFAGHPGVIRINSIAGGPRTRFRVVREEPTSTYAKLLRKLRIAEPARQGGVVSVSIDTQHPQVATLLLNELMRGYLDRAVQVRTGDAARSLAFLEQQLPTVKASLEKAEDALSDYRARTQTVNLDQQSESAFAQVLQLERSQVELELKQRELAQRFGDSHPQMVTIRQQLDAVKRRLGRLNGTFGALPRNQRDLVRLEREVNTSAALYTSMLNSVQELKVARAGMMGNARIVDPPRASGLPVQPRAQIVFAIAAGLGVVAAFGAALVAGVLRPTIREAEQIESGVGLQTVVTVPDSARQRRAPRSRLSFGRRKAQLLTLTSPEEPAVESLRSFRMQLTREGAAPVSKLVLITSATAGAGKTVVAANLAALIGSAGRRVLLVEADMRHPRLHTYFGVPRAPGLADRLAGTAPFDRVVRREVLPRVDLLMAGKPEDNPAELLSSPRLQALLEQARSEYDHVIFDSVPILPAGDSLTIASCQVSTYLVARAEHTTVGALHEAVRRLDGVGAQVRGVVFNGAKRMRISNPGYYAYRSGGAY